MIPRVPATALLSVALLALLALTAVSAQSVASGNCSSAYNREIYGVDPNIPDTNGGAKRCNNWPRQCHLPTKSCDCDTQSWRVAPWAVFSWQALTGNVVVNTSGAYLGATPGAGQTGPVFRPYLHGTVSRTECCKACSGRNVDKINATATTPTYANGTKIHRRAYWQHVVAGSGASCNGNSSIPSDLCGNCIIYPVGSPEPWCNNATMCADPPPLNRTWAASLYSTVGKGCPGGKNDPHFVGARGTHFDFNGVPDQSFCLITDEKLQVNMKMRGYYDQRTVGASVLSNGKAVRTWIKDLGIIWIDAAGAKHSFKMWARDGKSQTREEGFVGGMESDGAAVSRINVGETAKYAGGLEVQFIGYEKQGGGFFDVDVFEVRIPGLLKVEVKSRIAHPLLQTADDAMTHINVKFVQVEHTSSVHGVLGQTFRDGREKRAVDYTALSTLLRRDVAADSEAGKGFLDGSGSDYKVTDVLSSDCLFSAFGEQELPASV